MACGLVHRTKRLGKAARARLELHEVPTKLPGAPDRDGSQSFGRPFLAIGVSPCPHRRPVGHPHRDRSLHAFAACHLIEFKLDSMDEIATIAARLRAAAEARPMRLPVNRRVDETHHVITPDGLSVWYTIQVSPHSRIQEAIFERADRVPTDQECRAWLELLIAAAEPVEAPGMPGSTTRRFEAFERSPEREAPLA